MHLLISNEEDVTTDLLCERLEGRVLRLNWERWANYDIDVTALGFRVADHYGREVTDRTIGNIIWRKPLAVVDIDPGEAWYCFHEFKYAVESVMEWARQTDPRKLPIDPVRNASADKFKQLRVASRYLPVPAWQFTSTPSSMAADGPWVAKSLTGRPIPGTGDYSKVIYTSRVKPDTLADGFPWFLQRAVEAAYDLTVAYLDGKVFGFTLERGLFPGLDWRRSIGVKEVDSAWCAVDLPNPLASALQGVMGDLGLRYARFDLLAADRSCRDVWFLELNPNGQWAWLDLGQDNGLFDAMVAFLVS